jgi:hypothetical protein
LERDLIFRVNCSRPRCRLVTSFLFAGTALAMVSAPAEASPAPVQASCHLQSAGNKIKRVVYLQFDNVHLRRDNPNVPSDLEQMPHLLNFLQDNGTLSGNHYTPLISHTAQDIVSSLTGLYGDRFGWTVANSYGYFRQDGSVGFQSSFLYWNATSADGNLQMINESNKMAPAPWVPFTRAGCDVGGFSTAEGGMPDASADWAEREAANAWRKTCVPLKRLMRTRRVQALLVFYPRKMLIVSETVLASAGLPPVGSRKAHLDPVEPALRYGNAYGFPTLGLGADRVTFWRVRSALRAFPVRNHRQTFNFAAVHPTCHYAFLLGWPISS